MASRARRSACALLDARGELDTPLISVYEWADTANASDAAQRSYGAVHADRSPKPALDAVRESLGATPSARYHAGPRRTRTDHSTIANGAMLDRCRR